MGVRQTYELPEFAPIVSFIDAIFSEINIGLIIYHLGDPQDSTSLRLIYANREASRAAGADLQALVGLPILEAFPSLAGTDLPEVYRDIVLTSQPRQLGLVRYGDQRLAQADYSVRAFPMPSACVGVLFENVAHWGADPEGSA
jgi:hypothetical protein